MKVKVTDECIRKGFPGEETSCPIALALWDQFQIQCKIKTNMVEHGYKSITLPKEAIKFIEHFDSSMPVYPFEFDLPELTEWTDEKAWYDNQE